MTIVGIISDTHLREASTRAIPSLVLESFQNAQLILHGGDLTSRRVLDELRTLAPVLAVRGNNDYGALADELPVSRRIKVENVVIGLTHGDRPALGRRPKPLLDAPGNREAAAAALSHFEFDGDVSCIVFGHSHRPLLQERELEDRKIILLNPGSPTDKRYAAHFGCALLKIEGDILEPQLITW